ncbi:MAG: sulfatase-like hydrolase/transferase [Verrucomicrobiales bacterium]|nr:sulfatase-like hydrolase/transferase [Verrucomicrobiales bacterium]
MKPALILFALFSLSATSLSASEKPNILLILSDDLGFSDLGCYGGEIQTPHLDSLADNGLKFTQFYNTARCWPTRGSLLTGFYAQQIRRDSVPGVPSGGGNKGIRPDWAVLLPDLLEPVGYRSYHTGKWHIDGMPLENGFHHSFYLKDQGRFFNPKVLWKDDVKLPPVEKNSGFYGTTALADHVIEVLQDHRANYSEAPFFQYLAFAAPHFPLHALPEDIALYEDVYKKGWDKIRQQRWKRMQEMGLLDPSATGKLSKVERDLGPPYHFPEAFEILGEGEINRPVPWKDLTATQKEFQSKKMAIHAAMIHRMDIEIGRVFDQIKSMGEWENTIVLFLSDNGASAEIMVRDDGHDPTLPMGAADTYLCLGPGWSTTSNTPFRRHKTWTHEGGISTPLVVSWPDGIEARGETRREPGHVIDIVPTLLELAGATPHPDAPASPGNSLAPLFTKDHSTSRESIWWFHDGHRAIRIGDWKAVAPIAEPWELYDLSKDRNETTDLAIAQAGKLREMIAEWERLMARHKKTATADLEAKDLKAAQPAQPDRMNVAQELARPKRNQVLPHGESFSLEGRHAFLMTPKEEVTGTSKPWIFYAPTLKNYPDKHETRMHRQFLEAGIAVAGIDVGESYGSPHALPFFKALHAEMVSRGYAEKSALLGRSRGGLSTLSWAAEHPEWVSGMGGIYPVYDYTSYPGTKKAAPAYALSEAELSGKEASLNPIKMASLIAKAGIPVHLIHGTADKLVPLEQNSGALEAVYRGEKAHDLIQIDLAKGLGHSFREEFFTHQPLIDFLIEKALSGAAE